MQQEYVFFCELHYFLVILSWNALLPNKQRIYNACCAALVFYSAFQNLREQVSPEYPLMRSFAVIGSQYHRLDAMHQLCCKMHVPLLIDASCFKAVQQDFYVKPMATIHTTKANYKTQYIVTDKFDTYELVASIKRVAEDEWMYALKREEEAKSYAQLSHYWQMYKQGNEKEAIQIRQILSCNMCCTCCMMWAVLRPYSFSKNVTRASMLVELR